MSFKSWFSLIWLVFGAIAAYSQSRFDVYFVAIGSDNYVGPPDTYHFSPLQNAADRSALRVVELLQHAGARSGVSLVSDDGHYVSLVDIEEALDRVRDQIAQQHSPHPLLVFYFAGHGISEGIGWNHFSIPGDFASRKDIRSLAIDDLTAQTLHAATLVDRLESFKVPFVLLLDTCSEGKREDFRFSVLSSLAQQNLRDASSVLRVFNEFRDSYPVLFSAEPGQVALTAPDPRDPEYASLAPLARRLTLILDRVQQSRSALSLQSVLESMTSPALDAKTKPAVSHTEKRTFPQIVSDPAAPAGTIVSLKATSTKASICCGTAQPTTAPHQRRATGILRIEGKGAEFVTGGHAYSFGSPPAAFTITILERGRLSVDVDQVPGSPWSLSLDTGDGSRFAPRTYASAQRFDMGGQGHPGLEVSGDAHGCNAIAGTYWVDAVNYAPDGALRRLKVRFTQFCDDATAPLTGGLDIQLSN
jgi:Caspase domain